MEQEKQTRRQRTPEQKTEAIKRHVLGKEDVSAACSSLEIAPSQFYRWQLNLFENAAVAFGLKKIGPQCRSREADLERKVEALEKRISHKDEVIAEVAEECVALKKTWLGLKDKWVDFDTRDQLIDFLKRLNERTEISQLRLLKLLGLDRGKFYQWKDRYGKANSHNGKIPRDWWLEDLERKGIDNAKAPQASESDFRKDRAS